MLKLKVFWCFTVDQSRHRLSGDAVPYAKPLVTAFDNSIATFYELCTYKSNCLKYGIVLFTASQMILHWFDVACYKSSASYVKTSFPSYIAYTVLFQ